MPKPLIYLGSSHNLEFYNFVANQNDIPIHGIIDSDYWGNTDRFYDTPVIGSELDFDFDAAREKFSFFVASSAVPTVPRDRFKRQKFIDLAVKYKLPAQTLIDRQAQIFPSVVIEPGCFIGFQVGIAGRCRIGSHSQVLTGALLGHDTVIGQNSVIAHRAVLTGGTIVGDDVYVGAGVLAVNHGGIIINDNSEIQPGIILMRDVDQNEIISIGGKNTRRIFKDVIRN